MAQVHGVAWTILVGVALLMVVGMVRFSPAARLRRRLRKTHNRIVSKGHQPSVRLSVKVPKE
jgi:hypothetical protein